MYFFDGALKKLIKEGSFDVSLSLGRTSNQDLVLCPGNHLGYLKSIRKNFWSPIDWLNIYLDKQAYQKSKLVLACSEMMRDELVNLYRVPPSKIKVLHPPIDSSKFNPTGNTRRMEIRTKYGFSEKKKSLLFLTTGNQRKGYPLLLKLMGLIQNEPIELIVAGVKPLNSSLPNVKYVGYTDKPEELLWAADGLIHPAKYEPFGQVVTESIQSGTPVLISEMVGAKEIVNDSVGKIVAGFKLKTWKKAVLKFCQTEYRITTDYVELRKLGVEDHCKKILGLAKTIS
jgi:glycosyltransferase involved in cell wall biosynthesis